MNHNEPICLIDSHCHIDLAAFDADRDEVMARARKAGITTIVVPAVDARHWDGLAELAANHDDIHPAYGMHPMFMSEHQSAHIEVLDDFLTAHPAVAIGECGLDFHQGRDDADGQIRLLEAQLELARQHDLPVILHARKALQEVMQSLKRVGDLRGVVHSFSGSPEQARQLFDLGFHVGIGGPVTYPRAKRLRRIVVDMPLEWLLLETDSPDQPLCGHQGQRNEPARLRQVLDCIAELRRQDAAELAAQTTINTRQLFGLETP